MGQTETFSDLATHRLATTVTVYTSRTEVNVIISGTGPRGEGNHVYARPAGPVETWIKDLIRHTIDSESAIKWTINGYDVLRARSYEPRGQHTFSVWIPKR